MLFFVWIQGEAAVFVGEAVSDHHEAFEKRLKGSVVKARGRKGEDEAPGVPTDDAGAVGEGGHVHLGALDVSSALGLPVGAIDAADVGGEDALFQGGAQGDGGIVRFTLKAQIRYLSADPVDVDSRMIEGVEIAGEIEDGKTNGPFQRWDIRVFDHRIGRTHGVGIVLALRGAFWGIRFLSRHFFRRRGLVFRGGLGGSGEEPDGQQGRTQGMSLFFHGDIASFKAFPASAGHADGLNDALYFGRQSFVAAVVKDSNEPSLSVVRDKNGFEFSGGLEAADIVDGENRQIPAIDGQRFAGVTDLCCRVFYLKFGGQRREQGILKYRVKFLPGRRLCPVRSVLTFPAGPPVFP